MMNWYGVESSNVEAIAYRPGDIKKGSMVGILSVKFIKGGIYHYMDVPEELYQELLKAHSPGKFLAERIKNVYDYVKDQNSEPL